MAFGRILSLWLPVIIWMALIFWWSSIPQLSIGEGALDYWTRKPAHVAVYAILWLLLYRAVHASWHHGQDIQFNRRDAIIVSILTLLYAISDEWHQATVPTRNGQLSDVVIDTLGIILGLGMLGWWVWWKSVTEPPSSPEQDSS